MCCKLSGDGLKLLLNGFQLATEKNGVIGELPYRGRRTAVTTAATRRLGEREQNLRPKAVQVGRLEAVCFCVRQV